MATKNTKSEKALQKSIIRTLKSARTKIENGWTKGSFSVRIKGKTHYCVVGAVNSSTRSVAIQKRAKLELEETLSPVLALIFWNDDPRRRKRDVLRAFNRTINRLEKY